LVKKKEKIFLHIFNFFISIKEMSRDKDSDLKTKIKCSWYNDVFIIKAIGDGTCLFHAILKACDPVYQETSSIIERTAIAHRLRAELAKTITMADPDCTVTEATKLLQKTYYGCDDIEELSREYDDDDNIMRTEGANLRQFLECINKLPETIPPIQPVLTRYRTGPARDASIATYTEVIDAIGTKSYLGEKIANFKKYHSEEYDDHIHFWTSEALDIPSDNYENLELVRIISIDGYNMLLKYNKKIKLYRTKIFTEARTYAYNNPTLVDLRPVLDKKFKTKFYSGLPINCLFLTAQQGIRAYSCINNTYTGNETNLSIHDVAKNLLDMSKYVGFGDALDFFPIIGYNIILLEEETTIKPHFLKCLQIFTSSDTGRKYIVIVVRNRNHFELISIKDNETLLYQTIFNRDHPFIVKTLKQAEHIGTDIDLKQIVAMTPGRRTTTKSADILPPLGMGVVPRGAGPLPILPKMR